MGKINKNKKFMSTLLVGASAASLAASAAANISSAGVSNFLKYLNKPWQAYKWFTFDMVPEAWTSPTVDCNPFLPLEGGLALSLWLIGQWVVVEIASGAVCLIYESIKKQKFKNKLATLIKEHGDDEYIFHVDDLLTKEDETFINSIEEKYGQDYTKKLEKEYRKKVLENMLKNEYRPEELKNCEIYFKVFTLNNPESDKYFEKNKDNSEKDYGLMGINRFSADDLKFINEELPQMKDEIKFLKEKKIIKNDEDVVKDVRNFIAECYHFYNKNKKYTFLDGRMWFWRLYMNGVKNIGNIEKDYKKIDDRVTQFVCIGSDFSVEKNWYNKEKNYGLLNDDFGAIFRSYTIFKKIKDTRSNKISKGLINLVKDEEYKRYIEILSTNENSAEKVKNAFRKYVFYLHKCNKEIKKAEKGFDDFLKEENVKT